MITKLMRVTIYVRDYDERGKGSCQRHQNPPQKIISAI